MIDKKKQDELINAIIDKTREMNELLAKGPENNLNILMDIKLFMHYDPNELKSLNVMKYPEIRTTIHKWVKPNKSDYEE